MPQNITPSPAPDDLLGMPDYLIDALDGARDALTRAQLRAREAEPTHDAERAAIRALNNVARVVQADYPENDPRRYAPKPGYATIDVEAACTARAEASVNRRAAETRAKAAVEAYKRVLNDADRSDAIRTAARAAVDAHERAVDLWRELNEALDERDRAHRIAGSPGRFWGDYAKGLQRGGIDYNLTVARTVIDGRIDAFDVAACSKVADGEEAPTVQRLSGDTVALPGTRKKTLDAATKAMPTGTVAGF